MTAAQTQSKLCTMKIWDHVSFAFRAILVAVFVSVISAAFLIPFTFDLLVNQYGQAGHIHIDHVWMPPRINIVEMPNERWTGESFITQAAFERRYCDGVHPVYMCFESDRCGMKYVARAENKSLESYRISFSAPGEVQYLGGSAFLIKATPLSRSYILTSAFFEGILGLFVLLVVFVVLMIIFGIAASCFFP